MNFQIRLWLRSVAIGDEDLDRPDWDPVPRFEGIVLGAQCESSMYNFPGRLLVIRPEMNPSMPCRDPPRISTPACACPTVGANCRGKVTADVQRVGLIMRPLM